MLDTIPLKRKKFQHAKSPAHQSHVEHTKTNQRAPLTRLQKILIGIGLTIIVVVTGIAIVRLGSASTNTATPPNNLSDITSFVTELAPSQTALAGNLSGYRKFSYAPSSSNPIATVAYYMDGQKIYTSTTPPYLFTLDTSSFSDGQHTLTVVGFDTQGLPVAALRKAITITNGGGLLQQGKNIITYPWNWLFEL